MGGKWITEAFIQEFGDQVKKLAQLGCTQEEIAFILDIDDSTLRKHFRKDIDQGMSELRASIRRTQIDVAIRNKNPQMLIWLGKQLLKQKEPKQDVKHSGNVVVEMVVFGANDEEKDVDEEDTDS